MCLNIVLNGRFNTKPIKRNRGGMLNILHIQFSVSYVCVFYLSFQYELPFTP